MKYLLILCLFLVSCVTYINAKAEKEIKEEIKEWRQMNEEAKAILKDDYNPWLHGF